MPIMQYIHIRHVIFTYFLNDLQLTINEIFNASTQIMFDLHFIQLHSYCRLTKP